MSGARHDRRQRGQAMTEYALIAVLALATLFLPVVPDPNGGNTSIFLLFVQVFDIYINSFHAVISLPVP